MDIDNWHSELEYDQWLRLPVSGPRPSARYKHAAAVVDEKLYISGGSRNGRYLSDVQVFDLRSLVWSALKLKMESNADNVEENNLQEVFPATSGHNMIKWGNKLLILGGHSKNSSDGVTVRAIDLETHWCGVVKTSGKVPVARGGQSVTLVGSRLIMLGGEDRSRHLLNDVHVLDLDTMTWDALEATQTPPAPRFDHTAAVHAERYLFIFGGCSHSIFFNDLHILDLQTMEWSQPQIQGDLVTPRAGHAGTTIDENWYIVGGGDNRSGTPETLVFNMSKLGWSVLTRVKERDPLASEINGSLDFANININKSQNWRVEILLWNNPKHPFLGLNVCSALVNGEKHLVTFGGYNGKYNNEVFIMKPRPTDSTRPKIFQSPAAAAAAASVTAAYALAKSEKLDFIDTEDSNFGGVKENNSAQDFSIEINAIREENKVLESSVAEVKAENSRLREKIDDINGTYAELSKELHSVQGQLVVERSRCSKLEAQIAELQKMLETLQSIEDEVQLLRRQKSMLERNMELAAAQRQGSGGVWRWIAGTPNT